MIHNSMACRYANFTILAWAQHLNYRTHIRVWIGREREARKDEWMGMDGWMDRQRKRGGCIVKKLHFYFRSFCMSEHTETVVSRSIWLQFSHSGWIEMRFIDDDGKYVPFNWFLQTPSTFNICNVRCSADTHMHIQGKCIFRFLVLWQKKHHWNSHGWGKISTANQWGYAFLKLKILNGFDVHIDKKEKLLATCLECCLFSDYAIHAHGWQIKLSELNIVTLICLNDISPCEMLVNVYMNVYVRVYE